MTRRHYFVASVGVQKDSSVLFAVTNPRDLILNTSPCARTATILVVQKSANIVIARRKMLHCSNVPKQAVPDVFAFARSA